MECFEEIIAKGTGRFVVRDRTDRNDEGVEFRYVGRGLGCITHDLSLDIHNPLIDFKVYRRKEDASPYLISDSWLDNNAIAKGFDEDGAYWCVHTPDVDFFELACPLEFSDAIEVYHFIEKTYSFVKTA